MNEINADLFSLDSSHALAHCVGNDFIMGAGIATEFKKRFGNQQWLLENSKGVGTSLLMDFSSNPNYQGWKYIFYLISKPYSRSSKPTYESLTACLQDMFQQIKLLNIKKLAMPKIGCGLDNLQWNKVREIILQLKPEDLQIIICYV